MNLLKNQAGVTLEFSDIILHESADTSIYSFVHKGDKHFVETVAEPTERELIQAILDCVEKERVAEHAKLIRKELDRHVI